MKRAYYKLLFNNPYLLKISYILILLLLVTPLARAQWCATCNFGSGFNQLQNKGSLTVTSTRSITTVSTGGSSGSEHKLYWSFVAVAGRTYVFDFCEMGRVSGLTSNWIRIYDGPCASGNQVSYNVNAGNGGGTYGCHDNGYIEWTCTVGGTYYVLTSYSSCGGNYSSGQDIIIGYYYYGDLCSGVSYFDPRDIGGSGTNVNTAGNYYRNTNYLRIYTPPAGYATKVVFSSFATQSGSDLLYVYDGNSTAAPQVSGSPFSGNTIPGGAGGITSTASDGSLTFRFETNSDYTLGAGWLASVNATATSSTTPAISGNTVSCAIPTTTLTITNPIGGTTYSWSGPSTGTGTSLSPASIGVYTVTGTTSGGCTSASSYTVSLGTTPPTVSISASSSVINCTNTSVSLNGSTSASSPTYTWSGPASGSSSTISATASGTYSLAVKDGGTGCTNSTTYTVTSNTTVPNLSVNSSPTITCASSTVNISGSSSTGGVSYSWTGPSSGTPAGSTPTATSTAVSANGAYTLTATNPANGCTTSSVVTVNTNTTSPNISTGSNTTITCSSSTVLINGGSSTGGVTYAWTGPGSGSPAGSTPTATSTAVSASGTYTLKVTNPVNGCNTSSFVTVSTNTTSPNISTGSSSTITCSNATATLTGSSSTSGVSYSWTGPSSGAPAGSTPTATSTAVSSNGSYTLTITDPSNSCTSSSIVSVSSNTTLPNISITSSPTITCSNSTVTLTGNSSTSGASYSWTGPSSGTPAGSTPNFSTTIISTNGTYTLTVNDPINGCLSSSVITINTNTTQPNLSITTTPTITCTSSTVTLSGSSSTGGVSYSWTGPVVGNPAGSTPTASSTAVSIDGTYTLTATDPVNGCSTSSLVTINTNTNIPNITTGSSQTITCTNTVVTITGNSSTSGANYSWTGPSNGSPAGSTPSASSTAVSLDGTYTLTVTDPINGCNTSSIVAVSTDTANPDVSANTTSTITCAALTGTLNGSSGTPGGTYSWTGPAAGSPAGSTPTHSTTIVSSSGTYTLTVTDPSTGCKGYSTVNLSINNTAPTLSVSSSPTITCASQTVTLSGNSSTGGVTYDWTGPNSGTPAGTSPNSSTTIINIDGSYTLTTTDPINGCSSYSVVSVTSNTNIPDINVIGSQTITCSATSATISGSSGTSGATYSWTGPAAGAPAGSSPSSSVTSVSSSGIYTLTITDPINGCESYSVVSVSTDTAVPDVSANGNQTITCSSSSVTLSGNSGTSGAIYDWTGPTNGTPAGSTPSTFSTSVNNNGTYTLSVTDPSSGCQGFAVVTVDINTTSPLINSISIPTITCGSSTVTLSGNSNVLGADYSWTGPNTNIPAGTTPNNSSTDVNLDGSYTLTVTDPVNGCYTSTLISVNSNTVLPDISTASASETITCTNTTITLSSNSSVSGVVYSWTGPLSGTPAGSSPNSYTTTVSSSGDYTVTVTDPVNLCSNSAVVSVTMDTNVPQLSAISSSTISCTNQTVTLSGNSTVSGAVYSWTGPTNGTPAGTTPTHDSTDVSVSGSYTLTVTDPINGCSSTTTIPVYNDTSMPDIQTGTTPTITCSSLTVTLQGTSTHTNVSYSWTGPGSNQPSGSTPSNSSTDIDTDGTYTLTVTDITNGCSTSQIISVTSNTIVPSFNSISTAASSNSVITCTNASLSYTASASGGNNINWNGPSGPISGNPINISSPGDYTVTATDPSNGCSVDSVITISTNTISPSISSAMSSSDSLYCASPTVNFSATSTNTDVAYSWSGPNGYLSNTQNPSGINTPGHYTLTITDPTSGCSTSSVVSITQGTNPSVSFTVNPTSGYTPLPVSFNNTSSGGFSGFNWTFGNGQSSTNTNANTTYSSPGTYTVLLVGIAPNPACNDTATTTITVIEQDSINIPNIFTPNGDGINDVFFIKSKGYTDLYVEIYNRWGERLAIMQGVDSSWDGTAPNGEKVPDATYFYLLTATKASGEKINKQGYLTLIR